MYPIFGITEVIIGHQYRAQYGYPIIMYGSKKLEILSSYPIFTKPSGIVAFIDISFIYIHFGRFLHVLAWFCDLRFLGQNARKCEKQAIYSST